MVLKKASCSTGTRIRFSVPNDRDYEIIVNCYEAESGFATCIVRDCTTNERYMCNGRIVLNGHIITAKWDYTYELGRDNYVPNRNITITVDE